MSAQGILTIERLRRYTAFAQPFKVLVDGIEVGAVKNGTAMSVDVAPGHHEVLIKIEITQSPPVHVDVPPGGTVALTCRPRANPFSAIFYTMFSPKKFLRLDPA